VEAVAGAQVRRARLATEPLDLARRHHPAIALVALGPDAALTVPAAQRVDADPERLRRLADAVELPRHVSPLRRCGSWRHTTAAGRRAGRCQGTYARPSSQMRAGRTAARPCERQATTP